MSKTEKKKSTLFGDVARIASGTAFAQVLAILISPIITRIYAPEAFGVVGFFLSVIAVLSVNSTLRYHFAIILADDDKDAVALSGLSFVCVLLVSSITGFAIFFSKNFIEQWFDIDLSSTLTILVPIAIMMSGIMLILRQWHIRFRSYSSAATGEGGQSLANATGQLSFGLSGLTTGIYLIFSTLIGQLTAIVVYIIGLPEKKLFYSKSFFDLDRIKAQAYEHRKFFQFSTISGIINKFSWEIPSFFLLYFFDATILGFYILGHRLLRLPVSLIGNSIGQVYFERASDKFKQGALTEITELVQKRLVQVGFFPFFVLTFIGKDLFTVFFGVEWATAGLYTQILSIWTFVWFISSPISNVFSVTNNHEKMVKVQMVIFVLRFIGLLIGGLMASDILAISLFALAGILGYGFLIKEISKISEVSILRMLNEFKIMAPACIIFGVIISVVFYFQLNAVWVSIVGILSIVVFYPYIIFKEPELKNLLKRIF